MSKTVIGYGNTLRSDDGLGWQAANLLADRFPGPEVNIITCQQLSPELVEEMAQSNLVIFIDAGDDSAPGEIRCTPLAPEPNNATGITHHFKPGTLLALCQAFYGSAPEAYLYSVGAASFEMGEQLTPVVAQALPELVEQIVQHLNGAGSDAA